MRVEANSLTFNVVVDGPEDGHPVLLLHGFPDSSYLWRHQIPALAAAGFRVIAPDLRGFGESDKPAEVEAYGLLQVDADVNALLDALGVGSPAHVVGHDWGAAVAWLFATLHPDRTDRLAVLSVGHPTAFRQAGTEQRMRSWYMLLFQFEGVAEEIITRDDWAFFREWSQDPVDFDRWVQDLSRPGALTAALNWYRANAHPAAMFGPPPELPPVPASTLGIWSDGDIALLESGMKASAPFVAGGFRYERIDGASHWMQVDAPDRVNALLLEHFAA